MSQFLVLFREPDGRTDTHSPEYLDQHRKNMKEWIEKAVAAKQLTGGLPLTLQGKVIKGPRPSAGQPTQQKVSEGPYTIGTEIVGGYMFIEAPGLEEAAALIQTCPIFDSGGFAEVREVMNNPSSPRRLILLLPRLPECSRREEKYILKNKKINVILTGIIPPSP